jgi:hypothetical protein
VQCFRQQAATLQRAGDERQAGWELRAQGGGSLQDFNCGQVELPVADAGRNLRPGMADQENLHSRPM